MYATILSIINVASQQRCIFHIRGHLDVLYFLTFISSLFNIRSLYLKYGMEITIDEEYSITLWILSISFLLLILTSLEPRDDPECAYPKHDSKVYS